MEEYYRVKWFNQQKDGNEKFEKKYAIYNCFFTEQGLVLKNPKLVRKLKQITLEFTHIDSVELSMYTIAAITLGNCYRLEIVIHTTDLRCIHLESYPFPKFIDILKKFEEHRIMIIDSLNLLPIIQKDNYTEELYDYFDKHLNEFVEKYNIDHPRLNKDFSL